MGKFGKQDGGGGGGILFQSSILGLKESQSCKLKSGPKRKRNLVICLEGAVVPVVGPSACAMP